MSVTVTKIFNPFQRDINDIQVLDHIPGLPLSHYAGSLPDRPDITAVVAVNGHVVDAPLDKIPVNDGDKVAVAARADAVVAGAIAGWVVGAIGAAGVVGSVVYGATFLVTTFAMAYGMSALASALGPDTPDASSSLSDTSVDPVYGWGELQQTSTEGVSIPYVFGSNKLSGNVINQFVTISGNKETLNILLGLADHEVNEIRDVRLNDQPYTYYKDVTVTTSALGTLSDAVVPGFENVISQIDVGSKLDLGSAVTQQTDGTAVEKLFVIVTAPNGLYYTGNSGALEARSASFDIHYRAVGAGTWTLFASHTMTAATTEAIRELYQIGGAGLPPGQYEVKITRTNAAETSYRGNNDVYFTALQEVVLEALTYPGLAKLGVTALATDQLSGGVPSITCIVDRDYISVYNEDTSAWESKRATNPAWIAYALLHDYAGISETRLIWDDFKAWGDYCDEPVGGAYRFHVSTVCTSTNFWSEVQRVAKLGRAAVIRRGTQYGVFCDKPEVVVSHMFNMGNIVDGSFSLQYLPKSDRANAVEIEYTDPDRDYTRQVVTVHNEDYLDSDTNSQPARVSINAAIPQAQAIREGVYRINSNTYLTRVVKFDAFIDSFACTVGDLFYFQHESIDYDKGLVGSRIVSATSMSVTLDREVTIESGTVYKVKVRLSDDTMVEKTVTNSAGTTDTLTVDSAWGSLPSKYDLYLFGVSTTYEKTYRLTSVTRQDDFVRTITGVEYVPEVYTANDGYVITEPTWENQKQLAVNVTLNEFLTYAADGGYQSNVQVSWHRAYSADGRAWTIWLEDTTAGTVPRKVAEATSNTHAIIANQIVLGHTYKVYVSSAGEGPVNTGSNTATITIQGQQAPPDDVTNFYAEWESIYRVVNMVWTHVNNLDFDRYEIREGSDWDTALVIGTTRDNACSVPINEGTKETKTYLIKAMDKTGNESETAASYDVAIDTGETTISTPTGLTVTSSSNIGSDGTDTVMMLLSWDSNAETSDYFYQYAIRIEDKTTGKISIFYTQNNEHQIISLPNHQYGATVAAIDKSGNQTDWAAEVVHTTTKDTSPPADPTSLTAIGTYTQILLTWSHGAEADLDHFTVHRNTSNDSGTASQVGQGVKEFSGSMGMFNDTPPTNSTYYYWVKAVDTSGNESGFSAVASDSAPGVGVGPGSITETEIADDAVTTPKLEANSVTAAKIAAGQIGTDHLVAGAVTAVKMTVGSLSSITANIGTITAGKIQNSAGTSYMDLTNDLFSLGGQLTWNGSFLSIGGAASINGTNASTVVSNASSGATFTSGSYVSNTQMVNVTSIMNGKVTTGRIQSNASNGYYDLNTGFMYMPSSGYIYFASGSGPSIWGNSSQVRVSVSATRSIAVTTSSIELHSTSSNIIDFVSGSFYPRVNGTVALGTGSNQYADTYSGGLVINFSRVYDVMDDLDTLHRIKAKEDGTMDAYSLPKEFTSRSRLKKMLRDQNGDLLTDDDIETCLNDPDDMGGFLQLDLGNFVGLIEGAVRQSDREFNGLHSEAFEWMASMEKRIKTIEAAVAA